MVDSVVNSEFGSSVPCLLLSLFQSKTRWMKELGTQPHKSRFFMTVYGQIPNWLCWHQKLSVLLAYFSAIIRQTRDMLTKPKRVNASVWSIPKKSPIKGLQDYPQQQRKLVGRKDRRKIFGSRMVWEAEGVNIFTWPVEGCVFFDCWPGLKTWESRRRCSRVRS